MQGANTLAYYDTATITDVQSFILQAPERMVFLEFLLFDEKSGQQNKNKHVLDLENKAKF
jgi:hypothetical protein